jgi:hypothetical protein
VNLDFLLEIPNIGLAEGYGQSGFILAKLIQEVCNEEGLSFGLSDKRTIINVIKKEDDYQYFNDVRVDHNKTGKINIFMRYALPEEGCYGAKYSIAMTMFETDALPPDWVGALNAHDLVITPTDWGRKVFKKLISSPVVVIPLPVNPAFYSEQKGLLKGVNDKFRFLTVGHYLPHDRKRLIPLIEEFHKYFKGENTELYVKTNCVIHNFPDEVNLTKLVKNKSNIVLDLDRQLSFNEMFDIYLSSHCGLYPSLGEGYGLPQAEMALLGRPLVVAYNSAMLSMVKYYPIVTWSECKPVQANYGSQTYLSDLNDTGNWQECGMEDFLSKAKEMYELWEKDKLGYENLIQRANKNNELNEFISHRSIKEKFRKIIKYYMEKV